MLRFPEDNIMNHGRLHILAQVRKYLEDFILKVFLIIAPFILSK